MIRIYTEDNLLEDKVINIEKHKNYLFNVMRLKYGDTIRIFNQSEWQAIIISKSHAIAKRMLREPVLLPQRTIALSLIKQSRLEIAIEKCTELGITDFFLLNTEFSNLKFPNIGRLKKISIEAAEQCGRLSIPIIHKSQSLENWLKYNMHLNPILFDINGERINHITGCPIIGPEGGFSGREIELMQNLQKIQISENILRAETAAITASGIYAI